LFHLKENQKIFNALFESVSEGVLIVDENQKIVATNTSAEKIFGYQNNELINKPLKILLPTNYKSGHHTHFSTFMNQKTGGSLRSMGQGRDLFALTKNNKEFPIEVGLNHLIIDGKTFAMALVVDITLRKKNEAKIKSLNSQLEKKVNIRTEKLKITIDKLKELNINYQKEIERRFEAESKIKIALKKEKELNDLKTKFLSLVSHEFKTPLSGILTSAILLEKYKLTEQQEKREKHLKTITNKVHYLNNILNDFLSIEKLETGKVNYNFSKFNLSKVVNEVVYNANMLLKSGQKITIPQNIDEFNLVQDEKILELSLSNLIHNGIKYSPENTIIDLKVHQDNESIVIKVIDHGIGIPENDQKFIFNRYFRAENVLNEQGTGIGLNIVKVHLENLGGSINFISEINKGSVFTINLPMKKQ
jgi:hypothetical protein